MKKTTDTSTQLRAKKDKELLDKEFLEWEKERLAGMGLMYDEDGEIVPIPDEEGYTTLY